MTSFAPPSATTTLAADVVWRALRATQAAAVAAAWWAGRGDAEAADAAATAAMRSVLAEPGPRGIVVTGEGGKDGAPMLADGEQLGDGTGAAYAAVATALGKRPNEVRAVVLDKPRHTELVARLRRTGCAVATPTAGDVAGALMVLTPNDAADVLLGVGGTREGVLAACAGRALGGFMHGRLAPQGDDERVALAAAGADLDALLDLDTLVAADAAFVATGVTGGLLDAPRRVHGAMVTDSLVIAGGAIHHLRQMTPTKA